MELALTADQQRLRADIEDFLQSWLPPSEDLTPYFAALAERGWSAPGWPALWCGGGLAAADAFLVEHTLAVAGAETSTPWF